MKSIQSRFVALTLMGILTCTLLIGGFGLWSVARLQEDSSNQILSLTCARETDLLDQELLDIEGSVDSCADEIEDILPSVESLSHEDSLNQELERCEQLVGSIAQNTSGVCTYYLRFAPELSNDFAGFFYTKQGRDGTLQKETLTDITAFDSRDTEHVGWYFQPRAKGAPMWMAPYYNKNIGVYMVSYVSPLYVDDTFVGVVGMDVDFNVVISVLRKIKPYKTGSAFLVSRDGNICFHPEWDTGTYVPEVVPSLQGVVDTLPSLAEGASGEITTYTHEGIKKKLAYCALCNDMVLMLSAEKSEINAPVNNLLGVVATVGVLLELVAALVVLRVSRRITRPLNQLVDVANQISEGNLDVELPPAGEDEVGILSRTIGNMLQSLRSYISGINDRAYRDELTRVKNKAAFADACKRLQELMSSGEACYALLMLDLNDLKLVNDRYGHDRGDDYLRTNCDLACHVFEHSPVYRIGGDEFVVLLERGDYAQRDRLLEELDERMMQTWDNPNSWERVWLAKGLAVCLPEDSSPEQVLKRADEAMYEDKRRMKRERAW